MLRYEAEHIRFSCKPRGLVSVITAELEADGAQRGERCEDVDSVHLRVVCEFTLSELAL